MGLMNRFVELDNNGQELRKPSTPVIARLEPARGLMWGPTLDKKLTWEEAKKACAEFHLFGFSDWRLPTVEELFLLADRSRSNPAIDIDAFPDTKSDWYWTSSPLASSPSDYAWGVHFYDGYAFYLVQYSRGFVRPVRSAAGQ